MFAYYLQIRVDCVILTCPASFLLLQVMAPQFSSETICLHSESMETLGGTQDPPWPFSVYHGPGRSDRARDGHVSQARPLRLSSEIVLGPVGKEIAICEYGYKPGSARGCPREEAHLENAAAAILHVSMERDMQMRNGQTALMVFLQPLSQLILESQNHFWIYTSQ